MKYPGGKYILDENGEPVICHDLMRWARWFEANWVSRVAETPLPGGGRVSTIFLGLDHNFFDDGPPILWESMVFSRDGESRDQRRYRSRADAEKGHAELVEKHSKLQAVS